MDAQFSGLSIPSRLDTSLTTKEEVTEVLTSPEVFQQFYGKLVETLPMDDPNFMAKLYSACLLPSYIKEYVESRSVTRTEKATRFLDQVIKPSTSSFNKLLNVMKDSEYYHVKELARLIRTATKKNVSDTDNDNGLLNCYNIVFITGGQQTPYI